jgi:hypothetical protein
MGQLTPHVSQTKIGEDFDRRYLTDGEVIGGEVTTPKLNSTSHIHQWLGWPKGSLELSQWRP